MHHRHFVNSQKVPCIEKKKCGLCFVGIHVHFDWTIFEIQTPTNCMQRGKINLIMPNLNHRDKVFTK